MPDLRDAFRIATDAVAPAPGALDRQRQRQRRRSGRRKAGAFVAVAAVLALVAGVIPATRPGGSGDDEIDRLANPAPATPHGLFALDVATGEMTPFHDPGEGTQSFRMSPDGTKLLMNGDGDRGERQLWVADPDGTHARVLVDEDAAWGSWFPDSTRIAYAGLGDDDTRQVQVLDLITGERQTLTDEASDVFDVTVSADGQTIVYVTTRPAKGASDPASDFRFLQLFSLIHSLDVGSGDIQTLFQVKGDLHTPSISPVDGRIAFDLHRGVTLDDMLSQIWLMNADGSEPHPIAEADSEGVQWVFTPAWSPDGSVISYGYDDNGTITTWIYDATSGGSRPVGAGWPDGWIDADTMLVGT